MARPTFDYVKAGDVIRVGLFLDSAFSYPKTTALRSAIVNSGHLRLVSLDASQLSTVFGGYSGLLIAEVQPLNDFTRLDDVTRYVAGMAQQLGLPVLMSGTRGEFTSKVEDTGGTVPSNLPAPKAPGSGGEPGPFDDLLSSPVALAVIVGAAVLLVIAVKK